MAKKLHKWWDTYAVFYCVCFLIAFIPLYPKLPLYQPIPGYLVRVRLEDLFVLGTAVIFGLQLLRKKVQLNGPFTWRIGLYCAVGLISVLQAFFVIKTIPLLPNHILKTFLHLLRYIEYFSLFFFTAAVVKRKKEVHFLLSLFAGLVIVLTAYGIGQKYLKWPVFSTMTRQFSTGIPLELVSSSARVPSTFAGHYDFAIYLSMMLPLLLSFIYFEKRPQRRLFYAFAFGCGVWSLMASALRTALVAYVCSIVGVTFLWAWRQTEIKNKLRWASLRVIAVGAFTTMMLILFGGNLTLLVQHVFLGTTAPASSTLSSDQVIIPQYELPRPKYSSDLASFDPSLVETVTVNDAGEEVVEYQQKDRVLSDCAKRLELSLCIRLEGLWPQAIAGFAQYPILGKGYGTLNKKSFLHLPEADATDNNYLRILGETGIVGFVAFFSILVLGIQLAWKGMRRQDQVSVALSIGYLGVVVSLLVKAMTDDVFVASKVAFSFWAIMGLFVGYVSLS